MPAVFKTSAGTLVAVRTSGNNVGQALLSIDGLREGGQAQDLIVTSFNINSDVSFQVAPTVGGPEYVYPFGDKLGDITVGLVIFQETCEGEGGLAKLMKYYYDRRISPTSVVLSSITFNGMLIHGLVRGLTISSVAGSSSQQVITGTLRMLGWIDTSSFADESSGDASDLLGFISDAASSAFEAVSDWISDNVLGAFGSGSESTGNSGGSSNQGYSSSEGNISSSVDANSMSVAASTYISNLTLASTPTLFVQALLARTDAGAGVDPLSGARSQSLLPKGDSPR